MEPQDHDRQMSSDKRHKKESRGQKDREGLNKFVYDHTVGDGLWCVFLAALAWIIIRIIIWFST